MYSKDLLIISYSCFTVPEAFDKLSWEKMPWRSTEISFSKVLFMAELDQVLDIPILEKNECQS